jgi:flagellar hook-associated protein 3 FlgL
MRSKARLRRIDQYTRNGANARLWIGGADAALQSAANGLGRAKTLAVQAGNDALGNEERVALAADIRSISDHLRTTANSKVAGRSIFSGTASVVDAYAADGSYQGDDSVVELDIDSNETVEIGLPGPEVFGTTNVAPYSGTVFQTLEELASAVEAGISADVRDGIEAIDVAIARVGQAQGRIGAVTQQLDAAEIRQSGETELVRANLSAVQDTDMAEAIIRLRSAEAGYQATMAAASRGLSLSLLDFLR